MTTENPHPAATPAVVPSQAPAREEPAPSLVYALGTLGYDFGTEARRDSFKQMMPPAEFSGTLVPANPYDARQMVRHLDQNPSEGRALIWTLNLELTPIYAIEPVGPFASTAYGVLKDIFKGQCTAETDPVHIQRVSVPGRQGGRTVRLFSGQVVPVLELENVRGLYGWPINALVKQAQEAIKACGGTADETKVRRGLISFLNRVYYDMRNLGKTSHDRALNFSVTNAFQAAVTFAEATAQGMELDGIEVEKSPYGRVDSDCWDVKLKFFDPENTRRARRVFRFTIDVSDLVPVTLGEMRTWSSSF